jgi:hypothetical protein
MTHPLDERALEAAARALYAINPTRRTLKGDYFFWTDLRIDTQAKWYDYARAAVTAYQAAMPPPVSPELIAGLNKLATYLTEQGEYEAVDLIDTVVARVTPALAQEPRP